MARERGNWTKKTYKISFNKTNGKQMSNPQSLYNNNAAILTPLCLGSFGSHIQDPT